MQQARTGISTGGAVIAAASLLALAWLAFAPAPEALAHANYESSTPADGETVAESPAVIDIFFGQEMLRSNGLPTVIVVNDAGDQVDLGATLDDDDRTHISVAMPPGLPDGRYTVIWHTLSDEDAEEAQGAFHFFVGQATQPTSTGEAPTGGETAAPTEQPTAAPSNDDSDGGGVSVIVLVLGVVVALGLGAGLGTAFARRRAS